MLVLDNKQIIKTIIREYLVERKRNNFIDELKYELKKYKTDEELLRNGGIPIEILDRLAFGFSADNITTLTPDQLKIKWKDDLENVIYQINKSGLTPKQWSIKIDLTEPIDVSYWEDKKYKRGFYIEDGHHRYMAAKILNKPLNVNLEITINPIKILAPNLNYDEFHRFVFNLFKNNKLNNDSFPILKTTRDKYLNENSNNEIKFLQKQLKDMDNWFGDHTYGKIGYELRDEKEKEAVKIRLRLYQLTGDYYGETKADKEKKKVKPNGLDNNYNYPDDVPKNIYRWILNNTSLLSTDATDAVRWSRIINTKNDSRYPKGQIIIYRAVDNHDYSDIREGDWVTTDKKYAIEHNNRYFNGKGKIISMNVDGRDVLVSPTGNYEEAIYAPLEYSIDIKL